MKSQIQVLRDEIKLVNRQIRKAEYCRDMAIKRKNTAQMALNRMLNQDCNTNIGYIDVDGCCDIRWNCRSTVMVLGENNSSYNLTVNPG